MHSRKSILFHKRSLKVKKVNDDLFDVTMGSFEGVEVCKLIGLSILNDLANKYWSNSIGLYKDEGLAIFKNTTFKNTTYEIIRQIWYSEPFMSPSLRDHQTDFNEECTSLSLNIYSACSISESIVICDRCSLVNICSRGGIWKLIQFFCCGYFLCRL